MSVNLSLVGINLRLMSETGGPAPCGEGILIKVDNLACCPLFSRLVNNINFMPEQGPGAGLSHPFHCWWWVFPVEER